MANFNLPSTTKRSVAVIGCGVLGRRIACVWAAAGHEVHIYDPNVEQRNAALHYYESNISQYLESEGSRSAPVLCFSDLGQTVQNAWLVIECVPERLPMKIDLFAELEGLASEDAILCTNSSSYKSGEMLSKIEEETKKRVLNMHYMMPPMARVVELMTNGFTDPQIFPFLVKKLKEARMLPVVARKESTGFVFNRLWAAIKREVLTILSEEVSVPEEIDFVWHAMFSGSPQGPCQMMDSVGLDTVSFIEQHYVQERHLSGEHTVDFLKKYLDEGKLGAKSPLGGLYPPGHTTTTTEDTKGHHDNVHAPVLYFLDIGLAAEDPRQVFSKGRILMGGPDGRPLKTLVEDQHLPDGIDISVKHGKLFWTSMGVPNRNDGAILRSNLDGSNVESIVPEGKVHTPKQTFIDQVNSKIYFSDREGLRVMRCGLDGSELETIVKTGDWENPEHASDQDRWCVGVTVSPATGKFYWTQKGPSKGSQGRIFSANIDFNQGESALNRTDIECLLQHLPEPIDLEIDEHSNSLYWTDRGELPLGNSVNRVPLDKARRVEGDVTSLPGKDYEILVRNLHEAIGLKLDLKNRHMYITDLGGSVYRFDMDGSDNRKCYDGEGAFAGITLSHV